MKSPYQFGAGGAKTHRWIKIARGTSERTIAMSIVSNSAAEVSACLLRFAAQSTGANLSLWSKLCLNSPHSSLAIIDIPVWCLIQTPDVSHLLGALAQEHEFRRWIEQCEKDQVALPTVADIDMIQDQLKSADTCAMCRPVSTSERFCPADFTAKHYGMCRRCICHISRVITAAIEGSVQVSAVPCCAGCLL